MQALKRIALMPALPEASACVSVVKCNFAKGRLNHFRRPFLWSHKTLHRPDRFQKTCQVFSGNLQNLPNLRITTLP